MKESLLFAVCAVFAISCVGDVAQEIDTPAPPTVTPLPLPAESAFDEARNEIVNEAVRFALAGCPGINERLAGPPTRVLAALTRSTVAGANRFINPESNLNSFVAGPGDLGAVTVWVVAVEGPSVPISSENSAFDGANTLSFVFTIWAGEPEISGCVARDAPIPLLHNRMFSGGFEFEVLLDRS